MVKNSASWLNPHNRSHPLHQVWAETSHCFAPTPGWSRRRCKAFAVETTGPCAEALEASPPQEMMQPGQFRFFLEWFSIANCKHLPEGNFGHEELQMIGHQSLEPPGKFSNFEGGIRRWDQKRRFWIRKTSLACGGFTHLKTFGVYKNLTTRVQNHGFGRKLRDWDCWSLPRFGQLTMSGPRETENPPLPGPSPWPCWGVDTHRTGPHFCGTMSGTSSNSWEALDFHHGLGNGSLVGLTSDWYTPFFHVSSRYQTEQMPFATHDQADKKCGVNIP